MSKRSGFTLLETIMVISIIGIMTTFMFVKYQKFREYNIIKMDKTRIVTTISNANVMARNVLNPRYMKFVSGGIIVARASETTPGKFILEIDPGLNEKLYASKGLTTQFDCKESKPTLPCPVIIYEDTTVKTDSNLTIPDNLIDITTRQNAGYIMLKGGTPERPFTIYTFDSKGVARYRIQFLLGAILQIFTYKYVGNGSTTTANIASKHIGINIQETGDWKLESQALLPLKIQIN